MPKQPITSGIAGKNEGFTRQKLRSLERKGFWIGFAHGFLLIVLIFPLLAFLFYKLILAQMLKGE